MPSDQQKREFAEELRRLREKRGWTGTHLAYEASKYVDKAIPQQSISEWEDGRVPRAIERVDALSYALDAGDKLHRILGLRPPDPLPPKPQAPRTDPSDDRWGSDDDWGAWFESRMQIAAYRFEAGTLKQRLPVIIGLEELLASHGFPTLEQAIGRADPGPDAATMAAYISTSKAFVAEVRALGDKKLTPEEEAAFRAPWIERFSAMRDQFALAADTGATEVEEEGEVSKPGGAPAEQDDV